MNEGNFRFMLFDLFKLTELVTNRKIICIIMKSKG